MYRPRGVLILLNCTHMESLSKYFGDTIAEMRQVSWPTQSQALKYTAMVVLISAVAAVFLASFDTLFSLGIDWVVKTF